MPADEVEKWLRSGKFAQIGDIEVRLREHPKMKGIPLSIQRGQAEAFYLSGKDGQKWILKKFLPARTPDRQYLQSICGILPQVRSFLSGTDRRILSISSLVKNGYSYYSADLANWMDGTVLMPKIDGLDWAAVADEIRGDRISLEEEHRMALCLNQSELVAALESAGCSHRDLSSGNVFIETRDWSVHLIDWDSVYHSSLSMPANTTCGTSGYTAPFVWRNGDVDLRTTWHPQADRFSLAILNVEFLTMCSGAPLTAEGGMFDQDELRARRGNGLNTMFKMLASEYPEAVPLLEQALQAENYDECPSPDDWVAFSERALGPVFTPPRLSELETVEADYFEAILRKRRPAAPLWPAPRLEDLPEEIPVLPTRPLSVTLPEDPWESKK